MSRGSGLPWFAGTAQQCLDTLKFVHGDHGWMLARKALAFPLQNSSIEGIGEKVIKRTQGDGLAANTFAAHGSQSPLACCNFPNTAGRIRTSQHEPPHLLHEGEAFRVGDDRFRL